MIDWYKDYLNKQDILARLPNKYREAQKVSQDKSAKKPYYIVKVVEDADYFIDRLRDVREWAYSAQQARYQFLNKYSFLREYVEVGYNIEARIDVKAWQAEQQRQERQRSVKVRRKKENDERIQDMWWNKD